MLRRLLPFLLCLSAFAQQGGGELRISVRDAAAVAMAAHVELVSQSSHTHEAIDLPADGRYSFRNLPFGFYTLPVSRTGFAPYSAVVEVRSELPQSRTVT